MASAEKKLGPIGRQWVGRRITGAKTRPSLLSEPTIVSTPAPSPICKPPSMRSIRSTCPPSSMTVGTWRNASHWTKPQSAIQRRRSGAATPSHWLAIRQRGSSSRIPGDRIGATTASDCSATATSAPTRPTPGRLLLAPQLLTCRARRHEPRSRSRSVRACAARLTSRRRTRNGRLHSGSRARRPTTLSSSATADAPTAKSSLPRTPKTRFATSSSMSSRQPPRMERRSQSTPTVA